MDHLFHPSSGLCPVEIPYLNRFRYDGQGLEDFPRRQRVFGDLGWTFEKKSHAASLVQAWLWFGLLEEFLGESVDPEQFIYTKPDIEQTIIFSGVLTSKLDAWISRTRYLKKSLRTERLKATKVTLDLALFYSDAIDLEQFVQIANAVHMPIVVFSVKILLDSLMQALVQADSDKAFLNAHRDQSMTLAQPGIDQKQRMSVQVLERRMRNSGWCPNQSIQFSNRVGDISFPTIYYLSSLVRIPIPGLFHRSCTKEKCFVNNLPPGQLYQTSHHLPGCPCSEIAPNLERVIEILENGGIPLIEISTTNSEIMELKVVEAKKGLKYTAISHVWSHGLGNYAQNAVNECQLNFIKEQLQCSDYVYNPGLRASSITRIWMDTLCVPVGDEHKHLRKLAINRMSRTYSGAENILILDSELRCLSSKTVPEPELLARIFMSDWGRRCWTLQESILARDWIIAFEDGPKFVSRIYHTISAVRNRAGRKLNFAVLFASAMQLHLEKLPFMGNDSQIQSLWNELSRRTTSKPSDKDIITGVLLNLNAAELQNIEPESRFKAILGAQKQLPLGFLLSPNSYSSLHDKNTRNRWLPDFVSEEQLIPWGTFPFTRDGLLVSLLGSSDGPRLLGLILPAGIPRLRKLSVINQTTGVQYWIELCCQKDDHFLGETNDSLPTLFLLGYDHPAAKQGRNLEYLASLNRGARLAISENDFPQPMRAIFDCPVKISMVCPSEDETEWPEIDSVNVYDSQKLYVDCGQYFSTFLRTLNEHHVLNSNGVTK